MRTAHRPRRYVAQHWLVLAAPLLRFSQSRDAYVLRVLGTKVGPVLKPDRRAMNRRRLDGPERRQTRAA